METAIFGLAGVVLGALLTIAKEWWFQRSKNKKDAEYLSIQVLCRLEQYIWECADVAGDDGLCCGQLNKDGRLQAQVKTTKFEPELLNVEWKSIPPNLMYGILDFPNQAILANRYIAEVFESCDDGEGFDERQVQYAKIGIAAAELAAKLRKHVGLPVKKYGEWNPVRYMEQVEQHRIKIEALQAAKLGDQSASA
ncbi:MAG: hypothetical protein PHI11_00500 [Gallionella sp.]|nr:hypothetical protein [Gallionella sp.]